MQAWTPGLSISQARSLITRLPCPAASIHSKSRGKVKRNARPVTKRLDLEGSSSAKEDERQLVKQHVLRPRGDEAGKGRQLIRKLDSEVENVEKRRPFVRIKEQDHFLRWAPSYKTISYKDTTGQESTPTTCDEDGIPQENEVSQDQQTTQAASIANEQRHRNKQTFDINNGKVPNSHGLPLPPFLRGPKQRKPPVNPEPEDNETLDRGVFRVNMKRTLKLNRKQAPFSTAFHENPYALALATPVREDCFTGAHLPNICLLDFHITETDIDSPVVALEPVSLAAELIPKKKADRKLTIEEREALSIWNAENSSPEPFGAASYVIAKEAAITFVSQSSQKRVPSLVISRRVHNVMSAQKTQKTVKWRAGMPKFLLELLRKILYMKLRFFFREKTNKDTAGILAEVPGESDLIRLNDVDDVCCVIRLRLPTSRKPSLVEERMPLDHTLQYPPISEDAEEIPTTDEALAAKEHAAAEEALAAEDDDFAAEEKLISGEDSNTPEGWQRSIKTDPSKNVGHEDEQPNPEESIANAKPQQPHKTAPRKRQRQQGWWTSEEASSFLANLRPLPPPLKPSTTYFPTLHYRNRRVPIYNLPRLLGARYTRELLEGTVFEDSVYVTVTRSLSALQAQMWLLKLHAYLAGEKKDMEKI